MFPGFHFAIPLESDNFPAFVTLGSECVRAMSRAAPPPCGVEFLRFLGLSLSVPRRRAPLVAVTAIAMPMGTTFGLFVNRNRPS